MAALSITGAVVVGDGSPTESRKTAAAIVPGKVVRYDATTPQKFNLADKNTLPASFVVGIAVCDADTGEVSVVAKTGALITFSSAILTAGVFYYLGDTGDIVPFADVASADYYTLVGYAETTTSLRVYIINTQVVKA